MLGMMISLDGKGVEVEGAIAVNAALVVGGADRGQAFVAFAPFGGIEEFLLCEDVDGSILADIGNAIDGAWDNAKVTL